MWGRTGLKLGRQPYGQIQGHGASSWQARGTRYSGKNRGELSELVASQLGEPDGRKGGWLDLADFNKGKLGPI